MFHTHVLLSCSFSGGVSASSEVEARTHEFCPRLWTFSRRLRGSTNRQTASILIASMTLSMLSSFLRQSAVTIETLFPARTDRGHVFADFMGGAPRKWSDPLGLIHIHGVAKSTTVGLHCKKVKLWSQYGRSPLSARKFRKTLKNTLCKL